MSGTGRARITFGDQLREYERRHLNQERRPAPATAADLLGPGIGPQAVQLSDWNDDSIGFTGFYFSQPGSVNSPDTAKAWMGISISDPSGTGYQRVTEYDDQAYGSAGLYPAWPGVSYTRAFNTAGGTTRLFSAWKTDPQSWSVALGADVTVVTTTLVNLGISQTVSTYSTAEVYQVTVNLDISHTGTLSRTGVFELWVGGVVLGPQISFDAGGLDGLRLPCTRTWLVSPLGAASTVFKVTGRTVGGSDTFVVSAANSSMSIIRVS